ncbi:hypothetical protein PINS_up002352 [Pythium insidiosum]|nr:hypothetical protein PINS_up002352 [Pythium insidiosum]
MASPVPIHAWTPPSPMEQQYFDMLFTMADEERRGAIGGRIAVAFFSRSNVDKTLLREVWNIADSQQRSELSRNEFYVAMRLISMAQRGEAINVQRFYEMATAPFPLPTLDGVPPPPSPQSGFVPGAPQPAAPTPSPMGGPQKGPFAITDEEKARYDGIFQQYDTDRDGFLQGGEAVGLFSKSGLDRMILRDIWAMADRTQDSRLDAKEFYIAMHLIVCISKRGLSMPTEAPQELLESVFGGTNSAPPTVDPSATSGMASRVGSMGMQPPVAPPAPEPKKDPMDAFAGLSPIQDSSDDRARSSSRTQSGSSQPGMPPSASVGLPGQVMESTSAMGAAMQMPMPVHTSSVGSLMTNDLARDRTSSIGSVSSVSTDASSMAAMRPPTGAHHGVAAMGSFHGMQPSMMGVPPASMPVAPRPFLSDEGEAQAVHQLDERNEELTKALQEAERKQVALEQFCEKLREIDQLRHELVTLSLKRDKVRAATTTPSAPTENPADVQTRQVVEQSLRALIDSEKAAIQKMQSEIAAFEKELQSSAASLPTPSAADASMGTAVKSAAAPEVASGFGDFGGFAGAAPATQTPAPGGFQSFSAFGDAPSASASTPAVSAPATASAGGFDAFDAFNF